MMNSKNLHSKEYLIKINLSGPQIIDRKKSYFTFDNRKNISKSPRRDTISSFNSISNLKKKEEKNENNIFKEKLDQIITENIKNRDGIEKLFDDPEFKMFL